MTRLTVTVPLCPSTNALYCNVPAGRRKSAVYKKWIKAARASLWTQKPAGGFPFFSGTFHVVVAVPETMTGDTDNRAKAPIDFLKKGVCCIPDDRKTYSAFVTRDPTVARDMMRITVSDTPLVSLEAA